MATTTQIRTAVASVKPKSIQTLIEESAKELGRALPAHLNPERLVRIALTEIRTNPVLAECTPASFLGSLFALAQIGLEPVGGRAYLLPFLNNKKIGDQWQKVREVQAVIGFKGLVELFYRHEAAISIDMQTVYEHDEFTYEYGTNAHLKHRPALKDRGAAIGYYAIARLRGGGSLFRFMSKEEALEHGRSHSKTYSREKQSFLDSSPWSKEPDAMCKKTVLIQLAKTLPLSVEIQRAISVDETSRDYRMGIDSAFDLPTTTEWQEETKSVETTAEKTSTNGETK